MPNKELEGEGNKSADRRYREGVRKTVEDTSEEERADEARELSGKEREAAEQAEKAGKRKAKH